jgi:hypothetical protein
MVLKAMLFCFGSMKINRRHKILLIIDEICEIIDECIDDCGMFSNRSPIDHFHVFRSLLEIRFIVRNLGMDLPKNVFDEKLSKMALVIRFLRLGDGSISQHSGNFTDNNAVFTPSRYMIDTALSVVEIKKYKNKPRGFERLETKKTTIIINTEPSNSRSKFNDFSEPGINIFDFEASFGVNKLINRADISVVLDGFRIKLDNKTESFVKKSTKNNQVFFSGRAQFSNRFFEFIMMREITIFTDKQQVNCLDSICISSDADVYFRFVFNNGVDIKEVNKRNMLFDFEKSKYNFMLSSSNIDNMSIIQGPDSTFYPSVEILSSLERHKEIQFEWTIESMI